MQPNTNMVESTSNFGRANPHFWSAQPKNDEGCGNQIFLGWAQEGKINKKIFQTTIIGVKFSVESKSELGKFGKYRIFPENCIFIN